MTEDKKKFGRFDYLKISILGFALSGLAGSMNTIILPVRLIDLVPETQKNTYLGLVTFTGLLLAMLAQPIIGSMSDNTRNRWGKRRPYILIGSFLVIMILPGIGLANSITFIFIIYCLLQISSNTAQAPYQAFIPDLVPQAYRGRASGIKNLLEILGGIIVMRLAAFMMGQYLHDAKDYWTWMTLGMVMIVFFITALFTVLSVKEPIVIFNKEKLSFENIIKSFNVNLKHQGFIWFLAARCFLAIPGVVLQIFALYYLMDFIGIQNPTEVTGDLMVVAGVCLLAVVYPAGWLSDKFGRKSVAIFSCILGALGIAFLYFSHNYVSIILSGALLGIANGIMLSSTWTLATDIAMMGEEGKYLGITNIALAGGSALARLVGPVIDFFNRVYIGLGYQIMLLICFISFMIGALLLIKVNHK